MVRVDVIYADLSGVYVDGKWQEAYSVDCNSVDTSQHEKIWEMGSAFPTIIDGPPRREWTIRLEIQSGSITKPNIEMVINDPEIHFWSKQQDYRWAREQYVIQEMQP